MVCRLRRLTIDYLSTDRQPPPVDCNPATESRRRSLASKRKKKHPFPKRAALVADKVRGLRETCFEVVGHDDSDDLRVVDKVQHRGIVGL